GDELFGLKDPITQKKLTDHQKLTCTSKYWNNLNIMEPLYLYHLKSRTLADVNWYKLFKNWSLQSSNIIEIRSELSCIYPSDYIFNDREYRAWRSLIKAAVPLFIIFSEFWTRNPNPSYDKETLFMLYDKGFLSPTPSPSEPICDLETCNNAQRFAKSISDAIDANKKGLEGKCRILSIVADNFTLEELRKSNSESL
ncbi:2688_t:CDS:2, partial [Entrophospora sp. SA101]